jgi:hypothetical protein
MPKSFGKLILLLAPDQCFPFLVPALQFLPLTKETKPKNHDNPKNYRAFWREWQQTVGLPEPVEGRPFAARINGSWMKHRCTPRGILLR